MTERYIAPEWLPAIRDTIFIYPAADLDHSEAIAVFQAHVETFSRHCSSWRQLLAKINDDLVVWGRIFSRTVGTAPAPGAPDEMADGYNDSDEADDPDPYDDVDDDLDRPEEDAA
jgi:hypothetical protein